MAWSVWGRPGVRAAWGTLCGWAAGRRVPLTLRTLGRDSRRNPGLSESCAWAQLVKGYEMLFLRRSAGVRACP